MYKYFFILFISVILIISCKKVDITPKSKEISLIYADPMFQKFIFTFQKQYRRINDVEMLKKYIVDGRLSDLECSNIHKLFSYRDSASYWHDQKLQNERICYLIRNYNLNKIPYPEKIASVYEALNKLNLLPNSGNSKTPELYRAERCNDIRVTCIGKVTAEAVVMHFGCASLDISIIGGILCHGAALTYQHLASHQCNLEYEECIRQKTKLTNLVD